MNDREIKKLNNRVTEIWEEMEEVIAGTGVASLIEELVDIEIQLERESNQ
jgi:hypothetical protein